MKEIVNFLKHHDWIYKWNSYFFFVLMRRNITETSQIISHSYYWSLINEIITGRHCFSYYMLYIHSITMPLKMFISKSVVKNLISENLWWSIEMAHWYARREERKQRIWLKHEVTMLMKIYIRKSRPRTKYKRFLGNNVKNICQYTQIIFNLSNCL